MATSKWTCGARATTIAWACLASAMGGCSSTESSGSSDSSNSPKPASSVGPRAESVTPTPARTAAGSSIEELLVQEGKRGRYGAQLAEGAGVSSGQLSIPVSAEPKTVFVKCDKVGEFSVLADGEELFGGGNCSTMVVANSVDGGLAKFHDVAVSVPRGSRYELLILEGMDR